mgnify:CR=1 FL=1
MKKFKIIGIIFLALFIFSGCTSNYCSPSDLNAIREKITIENFDKFEQEAIDLGLSGQLKDEYIEEKINNEVEATPKACMTLGGEVIYEEGSTILQIEGKSWSYAFSQGFFQGLLVYPISVLLIFFTDLFGANGYGQILSIIFVTIILRSIALIFTFKQTKQTQRIAFKKTSTPLTRRVSFPLQ